MSEGRNIDPKTAAGLTMMRADPKLRHRDDQHPHMSTPCPHLT